MKRIFILLGASALLAGCGSVTESIPTVKIEKRKSQKTVQSASYSQSRAEIPSEASMVCENDSMRLKAVDRNDDNDIARVMIIQDEDSSSRVLHEVEVNCRDYFLQRAVYPTEAKVVHSSTPKVESVRTTRQRRRNLTYVVQRGDTVWDIAREHCTSVKAISRLNGLGRGNMIDVGDRLELPEAECD